MHDKGYSSCCLDLVNGGMGDTREIEIIERYLLKVSPPHKTKLIIRKKVVFGASEAAEHNLSE